MYGASCSFDCVDVVTLGVDELVRGENTAVTCMPDCEPYPSPDEYYGDVSAPGY